MDNLEVLFAERQLSRPWKHYFDEFEDENDLPPEK